MHSRKDCPLSRGQIPGGTQGSAGALKTPGLDRARGRGFSLTQLFPTSSTEIPHTPWWRRSTTRAVSYLDLRPQCTRTLSFQNCECPLVWSGRKRRPPPPRWNLKVAQAPSGGIAGESPGPGQSFWLTSQLHFQPMNLVQEASLYTSASSS